MDVSSHNVVDKHALKAELNTNSIEKEQDSAALKDASEKLPRLCSMLIQDMSQLFNIYPLEVALVKAKANWPQYRFIGCSEYDMGEKPAYREFDKFSFYLIAASLGCASLTTEPSKAVGLIIAEHEDD